MSQRILMVNFFCEIFDLVFQGFRPPPPPPPKSSHPEFTPELVGIPLQFHFLEHFFTLIFCLRGRPIFFLLSSDLSFEPGFGAYQDLAQKTQVPFCTNFCAYFCSFEGSRAISKPAPNPGTHQTPVETLSDFLVNLFLTNLVRTSGFSSLFSAIAVFLPLSGKKC